MVSLNRQAHKWWSESYFALKCLGISPRSDQEWEIQLQFHWMPKRTNKVLGKAKAKARGEVDESANRWQRKINLEEGQGRKMIEDWEKAIRYGETQMLEDGGIVSLADAGSSRLLHSGCVVEIQLTTDKDISAADKAKNMKAMVDLQWACIQIATMSGAAESPDFLKKPRDKNAEFWNSWWAPRQGFAEPNRSRTDPESRPTPPEQLPTTSSNVMAADVPIRTRTDDQSSEKGPETPRE